MFNLFQENTEYKIMMLKVYGYMNELDDDFLESNNFSREEIDEGIKEIGIDFKHGGSCLNEIWWYPMVKEDMKKYMKIRVVSVFIVLVSVVLIGQGGKGKQKEVPEIVPEIFNNLVNVEDLYNNEKKIVNVDDYKFTVEEIVYDKTTNIGYFVMTVENENDKLIYKSIDNVLNQRFYIGMNVSNNIYCEKKNGKLILYTDFAGMNDIIPEILICDYSSDKKYYVEMPQSTNAKQFEYEDAQVYVSDVGLRIVSKKALSIKNVSVKLDGELKEVYDERNLGGSWRVLDENSKYYEYSKVFEEFIESEKVEEVFISD